MHNESVTVSHELTGPMTITKDNYDEVFESIRQASNWPELTDLNICQQIGLCPASLITAFSREALRLYHATDGGARLRTPEEYYSQPSVYLQTCEIIRDEEYRLMEKEEKKRGNKPRKT